MTEEKAKEISEKFNSLRVEFGNTTFNRKDLSFYLAESGIPSNKDFITAYVGHGAIICLKRNCYQFTSEPVYWNILKTAIEEVRNYHNNFQRKNKKEKKDNNEKELVVLKSPKPVLTEETAIAFLKNKGYKILKPVTEFQEV